jgi:hypothetical protein
MTASIFAYAAMKPKNPMTYVQAARRYVPIVARTKRTQ